MTSGDVQRATLADLSSQQAAYKLAIRRLIDAYAYCADRRDAAGQMALFTEDTDFLVYTDSRDPAPTQHLRGRQATGVSYCLAHHLKVDGSVRQLMIAAIRYLDTFVNLNGLWYFSQRKLMVDWTETRSLSPA